MREFTTPAKQAEYNQAEAAIREYVQGLVRAFRLAEKEVGAMQAKSALTIGLLISAQNHESHAKTVAVAVMAIVQLAEQGESA